MSDEDEKECLYSLPPKESLKSLFDGNYKYDKDTLLNRSIADLAEASDILKERVRRLKADPEKDGILLATLERWLKSLKQITDVVIEQKKRELEDAGLDLESRGVSVLFDYFVSTMSDSLRNSGISLGDQSQVLDSWETRVKNWEVEVRQRLLDDERDNPKPKPKKRVVPGNASRFN